MKPVTRNLVKTMKNLTKEEVYTLGKAIKCVEKHAPQEFSGRLDAEHRKNLLTAYAELEKETVPRYLFDTLKKLLEIMAAEKVDSNELYIEFLHAEAGMRLFDLFEPNT